MKDQFFEGEDFKRMKFKALIPKYYPKKYKQYIKEETQLLKSKVKGSNRVLEAGVGIGRLIPKLAPLVKEFIGIDNAELMLNESNREAKNFSNVKIEKCNLEDISKIFPKEYFDFSLCVWNTLGNVENEVKVLRELSFVTIRSIFITVYLKGTLDNRKNWYDAMGIKINRIDEENEIFYSKSGLRSKSYSLKDVQRIAHNSNLQIKDSKLLNGVMLWIELTKF
jgi:SAM-dependent methyltransferase